MDKRLADHAFLAGDYSIADMAVYPWVEVRWLHEIDIEKYPNVHRWYREIEARKPVADAMALLNEHEVIGNPTDETREVFFGKSQQLQSLD
jgi:GST-like protein